MHDMISAARRSGIRTGLEISTQRLGSQYKGAKGLTTK